jgi:hypothetical protein
MSAADLEFTANRRKGSAALSCRENLFVPIT